jgi:hypothetical protein
MEIEQRDVIRFLIRARKNITENVNELDLIEAYTRVIDDMESFDYP